MEMQEERTATFAGSATENDSLLCLNIVHPQERARAAPCSWGTGTLAVGPVARGMLGSAVDVRTWHRVGTQ